MNLSSKLLRICTGVQAAAIIAISMPVSTSYAAAPDPNWHVVKTQYKTDDYVIAGYEAKDFGISANGRTDVKSRPLLTNYTKSEAARYFYLQDAML